MGTWRHLQHGESLVKQDTPTCASVSSPKRFAISICFHWLWKGGSYNALAELQPYRFGHATVFAIVLAVVNFPGNTEVDQVLFDFESLCYLRPCCGAVGDIYADFKAERLW